MISTKCDTSRLSGGRTNPIWLSFFLILATLSLGSESRAESKSPEPIVTPTFGWAPGLKATVSSTSSRTRKNDDKRTTTSTARRYELSVIAEGQNLRIHIADAADSMTDAVGGTAGPSDIMRIAEEIDDMSPDYVVSSSGEFVGVHDLPGYQGRLRALLTDRMPKGSDPAIGKMLETVASEAYVTSKVASQWDIVSGAWLQGRDMELGKEYKTSEKGLIPLIPGEQVLMTHTFSARQRVTCQRGGIPRDCAKLVYSWRPDPEDMKRLLQASMSELGDKAIFTSLEEEAEIQMLTEPAGLIPHWYKHTRTMRGTYVRNEEEWRIEQIDVKETNFEYP